MNLSNLSPRKGSKRSKKRLGRGNGSGHGKTAGRGHNGYRSRSGSGLNPGFEGGQMPLQRRLPKRGFYNTFKKEYSLLNVRQLERFESGATINKEVLRNSGLVKDKNKAVKLLGDGDVDHALNIVVDKASRKAREKIEAAGGKIEETGSRHIKVS
ncbi:MAG: 50S ribosomal protein L15 [Thermodesulfobacteriota bacterium]